MELAEFHAPVRPLEIPPLIEVHQLRGAFDHHSQGSIAASPVEQSLLAVPLLIFHPLKVLQMAAFSKWAMLGSNQRPLPCEGSKVTIAVYRHLRKIPINQPNLPHMHRSLLR